MERSPNWQAFSGIYNRDSNLLSIDRASLEESWSIELVGFWRVVGHAPGSSGALSPVLHLYLLSNFQVKINLNEEESREAM
eukprot:1155769-Pelagomonas_calceolata.AAC.4